MEAQASVAKLATINPRSQTSFHSHQSKKPITLKISTYKHHVDSQIDSYLKKIITVRPPFDVHKPMHHLVFSTPKNNAPALCIAGCEAVGGRFNDALPAAAALHLMHVAASAHENILLGNVGPKSKYSFGQNIELLTGDGLVPLGLELLAMAGQNRDIGDTYTDRVARVIVEISRAIGSQGVIDAQYKKYVQASDHLSPHVKQLRLKKLKAKRGEFYGCSAACGAILGGGSDESIEMLRRCGIFVGMMNDEISNGVVIEDVIELRDLAMKELEGLDGSCRIEFISSLVDSLFCDDTYQVRSDQGLSMVR